MAADSPATDRSEHPRDLAARLVAASGRVVTTFGLRGDLDPGRLTWPDRVLMSALRRALRRTPDEAAAKLLLPRTRVSQVDVATLDPVVAWAAG